jgi:hypothetical protein
MYLYGLQSAYQETYTSLQGVLLEWDLLYIGPVVA